MSLTSEPAFSTLKANFVCGVKDISHEAYAGVSGKHSTSGQGINTTNGAGPHNLQLFVLAPDATVLHCLPGYWSAKDLVYELGLAQELMAVWSNNKLSPSQKNEIFTQMHRGHLGEHPRDMKRRSRMQSFDAKFEAKQRPYVSDTIKNPSLAIQTLENKDKVLFAQAFKTTDEIMHERMAQRPFVNYHRFDVAKYSDYGRQKYDKHEDARDMSGKIVREPEKISDPAKESRRAQRRRWRQGRGLDSGMAP